MTVLSFKFYFISAYFGKNHLVKGGLAYSQIISVLNCMKNMFSVWVSIHTFLGRISKTCVLSLNHGADQLPSIRRGAKMGHPPFETHFYLLPGDQIELHREEN